MQTIVNTDLADHPGGDPHHWIYKPGFYAVTERFQRVNGPMNDHITTDKIAIHHYVLKSREVRIGVRCLHTPGSCFQEKEKHHPLLAGQAKLGSAL